MPDRAWSRSTRCVGDEVADVVSLHADGRPGNAPRPSRTCGARSTACGCARG